MEYYRLFDNIPPMIIKSSLRTVSVISKHSIYYYKLFNVPMASYPYQYNFFQIIDLLY